MVNSLSSLWSSTHLWLIHRAHVRDSFPVATAALATERTLVQFHASRPEGIVCQQEAVGQTGSLEPPFVFADTFASALLAEAPLSLNGLGDDVHAELFVLGARDKFL